MTGRHRGFTLVEMLGCLVLLGAFGLVSQNLFVSTLTVMHQTQRSQDAMGQVDRIARQLRQDMWGAAGSESAGPEVVTIHRPDGPDIVWRWIAPGTMVRTAGPEQNRWICLDMRFGFRSTPGEPVLWVRRSGQAAADELHLFSQLRILQEARP